MLPSLIPIITTMFILRVGNIMSAGFEQLLVMQNDMVYMSSETIEMYSLSTYQNVIGKGLILLPQGFTLDNLISPNTGDSMGKSIVVYAILAFLGVGVASVTIYCRKRKY